MTKKIVLTTLILVSLTTCSTWAQTPTFTLPLGSVGGVRPMSVCPSGFTIGTSCFQATVSCPDTADIQLTFGVTNPVGFPRGTVAIFNGGGGTVAGGAAFVVTYVANGFQTVQVAWNTAWEETGTTPNIKTAACRPATVLNYFRHTLYRRGGMCAQGASAGSAAIAYSLAEYGAGDYLDNVELMAGPVLSDLATGCNPRLPTVTVCGSGCNTGRPPEGGWPDAPQYVDGNQFRIDLWTGVSSANSCTNPSTSRAQYAAWKDMSIVDGLGDSTFSYPHTGIAGWLCSNTAVNCLGTMCQNNSSAEGQLFYSQVASQGAPFHVYRVDKCNGNEGVGEGVLPPPNQFETGNTAIAQDMINNCTARH